MQHTYQPSEKGDLESYYEVREGVRHMGEAGKLQQKNIDGGGIFKAPRSSEFPLTPSHNSALFEKAARDLGDRWFPMPAPNTSRRLPQSARRRDGSPDRRFQRR